LFWPKKLREKKKKKKKKVAETIVHATTLERGCYNFSNIATILSS
jgi:hypothetical protein